MKKSIVYIAALAALTLLACNKAQESDVVVVPAGEDGFRTVTIRAGFETVKTAYSESGKFGWVEGDQIGIIFKNPAGKYQQIAFTTNDNGTVASFTGPQPKGYDFYGIATYPFFGDTNDFIYEYEGSPRHDDNGKYGSYRIYGSITADPVHPLSIQPLTGIRDDNGFFQFKSATGVVKFTIDNLPSSTIGIMLDTQDNKNYPLNGWFKLAEDGSLHQENAVAPWSNRYSWLPDSVSLEDGASYDFYFFLPVGTLPAGTEVRVLDKDYWTTWTAAETFVTAKDIEIVRNAVVNVEEIEVPVAVEEFSIDKESIELNLLETETIVATVLPEEASSRRIKWTSEPSGIVSVDNGIVTALGDGTAIITASCGNKSATCEVTVSPLKASIVKSLFTSWSEGSMIGVIVKNEEDEYSQVAFTAKEDGESVEFTGSIPEGFTSFTGIATYPFFGNHNDFIFDYEGSPRSEANSVYGAYRIFADTSQDPISPLNMVPMTGKMDEDGIFQFNAAVGVAKLTVNNLPSSTYILVIDTHSGKDYPLNGWFNMADDGKLRQENAVSGWSNRDVYVSDVIAGSSRDFYFFVPAGTIPAGTDVKVIGSSYSSPEVTFTTEADIEVQCGAVVSVEPFIIPGSITLNKESIELNLLEKETLVAKVLPKEVASSQPVVWTSEPSGIVSVENGVVTALGDGVATITATCGNVSATCEVTVNALKASIGQGLISSWPEGSKIGVIVKNEEDEYSQVVFTAKEAGESVEFTGSIPEGFTSFTGIATYPFFGNHNDFIFDYEGSPRSEGNSVYGAYRIYADSQLDPESPLTLVPMTGKMDEDGIFQFNAAVGVAKFTVNNLPSSTYILVIDTHSGTDYPLNGWFNLAGDGTLRQENAAAGWSNRDVYVSDVVAGSSRDFYFFVPAGTIPAGTAVKVIGESYESPEFTFTTEADVKVVCGAQVDVDPFTIPGTVTLDKTQLTMELLGTETLVPTVLPAGAEENPITWESSDEVVVTVQDGVLTARKDGTATITVTCGAKSASCAVTVNALKASIDQSVGLKWLEGSTIGVVVTNEEGQYLQIPFTAKANGNTAEFSGAIPEGYTSFAGIATCPYQTNNDFIMDTDDPESALYGTYRIFGSEYVPKSAPLTVRPLVGELKEGVFKFKAATSAVKFTIKNMPAEATGLMLESHSNTYPLNGWFTLDQDAVLKMDNAVSPWSDRYSWADGSIEEGSTYDFYFFLPLGVLPAGTDVRVVTNQYWNPLYTFTLAGDIELTAGAVIEAPVFTVKDPAGNGEDLDDPINTDPWL